MTSFSEWTALAIGRDVGSAYCQTAKALGFQRRYAALKLAYRGEPATDPLSAAFVAALAERWRNSEAREHEPLPKVAERRARVYRSVERSSGLLPDGLAPYVATEEFTRSQRIVAFAGLWAFTVAWTLLVVLTDSQLDPFPGVLIFVGVACAILLGLGRLVYQRMQRRYDPPPAPRPDCDSR